MAINPAKPVVSVQRESTALLKVYFSSVLDFKSSDIVWMNPQQQVITPSSRYILVHSNTELVISSPGVEDNGIYSVTIIKVIFGEIILNVSTTILLKISG